jgi:SPOR domain
MNEEPKLRPQQGREIPQPRRPEAARTRRGEDPLAELARLIGQEDPFANFEGGAHSTAPRGPAGSGGDPRAARSESHESRDRPEPRRPIPAPRAHYDDEMRARRDSEASPDSFRSDPAAPSREPRSDPGLDRRRDAPRSAPSRPRAEVAHATTTLARPKPAFARAGRDDDEDEPHIERPRETELPRFARRDVNRDGPDEQYKRTRVAEYDPEYADEADLPAHGDEIYDEEPRKSRRGLAVVAGVIGIAVVGTAGFFGYRALFGPGDGSPPPTIRADSTPVKVTPPGSAKQAEPPGGKQIYERLGGPPPAGERIVPREERPVQLNQPARVVTTPVPPAGPVPQPPPQQPAAVAAPPGPANTEPRRVRTVSVRADGTIVADQASRIVPRAPQPPLAVNAYANQPAEEPETPVPGGQARNPAPQGQGNQPWSIVEPPRPPARVAARSNTPIESGGFIVQVNSQKTEAEAQAAWRQMQSRYPNVLGTRQASIRRVDLGDRGVFYRAMLGPFASRDAASEVCQSLKTAGGDCIVQRN